MLESNLINEQKDKSLLQVNDVSVHFGGLKAISKVSFSVQPNQIFGLIGPNGAGKTTMFNVITGIYAPTMGDIVFDNQIISGLRPFEISRKGMTRTFQNIRLFKELSVLENVLIAKTHLVKYGLLDTLFHSKIFKEQEKVFKKSSLELLDFFDLSDKQNEISKNLSYGDQRKLEIVRALAMEPKLICLDEPAAGMNHSETELLMELIKEVNLKMNVSILLIEHDMKLVMNLCHKIAVLDYGKKIAEGVPSEIRSSPEVIKAYLGVDE